LVYGQQRALSVADAKDGASGQHGVIAPGTLDPETLARMSAVADTPDDQIDLTDPDAPEVTDWTGAARGRLYRPVKKLKSLRIDADVLDFVAAQGLGYPTRINAVLRDFMVKNRQRSTPEKV